MQIFRPFADHTQSAKYLDDIRLNKQVIIASEICESCLRLLGLIPAQANWATHPIVKAIYNRGKPFLPDLVDYMYALDKEFQLRGGKRGFDFSIRLNRIKKLVQSNYLMFSEEPMALIFIGRGKIIKDTEDIFDMYKILLHKKWREDNYTAQCSIKLLKKV